MSHLHYLSAFAELSVADLAASAGWYESALGFNAIAEYRFRGGRAVHLRRSEGQELLLVEAPLAPLPTAAEPRLVLNFAVDGDLAALAEAARASTRRRRRGRDEPEALELADPDGHLLRFYVRQR